MGACLFSLSFATVLFTLAIFKLLSFFIMPSLFFDLLFIGFPIGAFLGAAFFSVSLRSFVRSLWILQAVTVLSVLAVLAAKNFPYFDYLRAHLFEVEVAKLLVQMGTFTALFLPFFAAYGLSEYIGYQVGRRTLPGRMRLVYALYLFGAAGAYVFFKYTLPHLGIARILGISLACIAVAIVSLSGPRARILALVEVVAIASLLGFDVEELFLQHYKSHGNQSTRQFQRDYDARIVFQEWGKFGLVEILRDRGQQYHGFYNDFFQWQFRPETGFDERSLGMVPLLEMQPDSKVAIIGAGGGRQVRFAQRLGLSDVVAIEIEPAVFEAVRSPEHLLVEFDRVYERPGVRPVRAEARGYMENSEETFDLIYLPSVGGYPQMMMEPGNLVRTHEAYITMKERLSEDGLLAIWYPWGLDPQNILTEQYVRTLRALDMKTAAFINEFDCLILAYRDPDATLPDPADLVQLFRPTSSSDRVPLPPVDASQMRYYLPRKLQVAADSQFTPITDNRPFLAGNLRHILSMRQVYWLFGIGALILVTVGVASVIALRRRGDPQIPGRSYFSVVALTFLIGANFLVMEHYLVLALFKRTFIYYDSLMLGAISFLVLSGVGSMVAGGWRTKLFSWVSVACAAILLAGSSFLNAEMVLLLMTPIAVTTGMFFPVLFELAARNPIAVFALDAIGAGCGTLLATFLPITFGFPVFFAIAALLFLLTVVGNWRFHRGVTKARAVA